MAGSGQCRMLFLDRRAVAAAARHVDPVAVVRDALRLHAAGGVTLPDEAYLPWQTRDGAFARSLALPGALATDPPAIGLKLINSSLGNVTRGVPRAQGLTILFDPDTAYPAAVMEAAYLSSLRTAAYTAVSANLLALPGPGVVAIIGCGVLGRAHAFLLAEVLPAGTSFRLWDRDPAARDRLLADLRESGLAAESAADGEGATQGATVVVTATTTTSGYLPLRWLAPGALLAHVSLDDALPEVVAGADLLIVDDWNLVSGDSRRLLGRTYRSGALIGPGGEAWDRPRPDARRVDATLSQIVAGEHPGRTGPDQVVLSNPFGMGVLDVALASEIVRVARERDLGTTVEL